jgi:hypothetical protein
VLRARPTWKVRTRYRSKWIQPGCQAGDAGIGRAYVRVTTRLGYVSDVRSNALVTGTTIRYARWAGTAPAKHDHGDQGPESASHFPFSTPDELSS